MLNWTELAPGLRAEDQGAWRVVVHTLAPRLKALARSMGCADDTDDVVQGGFVRAHRQIRAGTATPERLGWERFFQYAVVWECRAHRKHLRAKKRQIVKSESATQLPDNADLADLSVDDSTTTSPTARTQRREWKHLIREGILLLPAPDRHVMWLLFVEDRPVKQVAKDLGLTIQQVHQIKYRAIRTLRAELGGDA